MANVSLIWVYGISQWDLTEPIPQRPHLSATTGKGVFFVLIHVRSTHLGSPLQATTVSFINPNMQLSILIVHLLESGCIKPHQPSLPRHHVDTYNFQRRVASPKIQYHSIRFIKPTTITILVPEIDSFRLITKPPNMSEPPESQAQPEPTKPGPRAQRLQDVYSASLTRTLDKLSYENIATCYPTIARRASPVLHQVQTQMVQRLREKCEREFDSILATRDVVAKINDLEGLIADAERRRKEFKKTDEIPTPYVLFYHFLFGVTFLVFSGMF